MNVKLLSPVRHSGREYQTSEILGPDVIDEKAAKRLIVLGVAEEAKTLETPVTPMQTPVTPVQTPTDSFASLTNPQMFAQLKVMGVPTTGKENKSELIALYNNAVNPNTGINPQTSLNADELEAMTEDEIRGELSVLGIVTEGNEDKAQLIALYAEATKV